MIQIISDSTCDLSPALLKQYNITILPLHVHLGEDEFSDGVDITPDEIYRWSDAHDAAPKTAAPSISAAIDLFRPFLDAGDELLCFSISSQMSVCGRVMQLAAEELEATDRIHVIDSANLSTGIGHLVLEAACMAQAGHSMAEIVAQIEALKPRVRASFVTDTLTYLRRGGRCSSVAAFSGALLQLHPRIAVENGAMHAGKKYRGKIANVILAYAKDMEADLLRAKRDRVFITHSGCPEETIAAVQNYLENLGVFEEIFVTRAGAVISSHCGPGTLGVLFIEGEEA